MTQTIEIAVNGEARPVAAGASIVELLAELGLPAGKVAVERNRAIVSKSAYGTTRLANGDQIEIVHFVGGG